MRMSRIADERGGMPTLATVARRVWRVLPFVALSVVLMALLVTAVWHEDLQARPAYKSPCVMSWDETGNVTFCILTAEAAVREKREASFDQS